MRKMKKEGIKLFIVALASFLMLVCIVAASPDSTSLFIDPTPANYTQEQDFTWGVLAINTHKSIYLPNEAAFVGIAVLDNEGHMVCDADVTVTITDPGNNETVLSTGNGLITVSPQCCVYGVTNLPDYYTNYAVGGAGTYVMNLTVTAVTADGTKSITDEFSVQNSVDFDVVRDGATRIYPPVPYVMNFTIKANKNYTGLIREYVPASFVITPQDGLIVTTVGDTDTKILTWTRNLVKGETYNIYYEFDAPDVSPYLFLLGRLQIGGFEEKRDWMIASDATTTETKPPTACGGDWTDCINAYGSGLPFAFKADASGVGQWSGYVFSVPTGATINSVKVKIQSYVGNAAKHSISLKVYDGSSWGQPHTVPPTETECAEQVIDVSGDFPSWTVAMVNAIQVELTATIGTGTPSEKWTRCCYLPVEVNYDYTPTWASDHDPYDSTHHLIHMEGVGFKTDYVYKVGYYDGTVVGGGDQVCVECGGISSPGGVFSSEFECLSSGATYGTWHSVVFDTTESIPATYNAIVDYVIYDGFTVQESAIPEFPTVIAAIAVCLLCAVAYVVMRRNGGKG